jgi:hypothetical protein
MEVWQLSPSARKDHSHNMGQEPVTLDDEKLQSQCGGELGGKLCLVVRIPCLKPQRPETSILLFWPSGTPAQEQTLAVRNIIQKPNQSKIEKSEAISKEICNSRPGACTFATLTSISGQHAFRTWPLPLIALLWRVGKGPTDF